MLVKIKLLKQSKITMTCLFSNLTTINTMSILKDKIANG